MIGLWFDQKGLRVVEDLCEPACQSDEAVVDVSLAGVCGTDLEITRGYKRFEGVLGHEFVGVVRSAPTASHWEGVRVVASINCGCGTCSYCRSNCREHCMKRTVIGILGRHGAFASSVTLPVENLLEVPSSLSDSEAVFAEPLAAALRLVSQIKVSDFRRSVVIGGGRLGYLVAQVLRHAGSPPVTVLRYPAQVERFRKLELDVCSEQDRHIEVTDLVEARYPLTDGWKGLSHAARPGAGKVLLEGVPW